LTGCAQVLGVEDLVAGYEPDAPIVRGVSLTAGRGELVAVLGPNGAGKSTLIKAIAGLVPPVSGRVRLAGRDITALAAHTMVRNGVAFVPQTENVFATLSVADNLKVAADPLAAAHRPARIAEVCRFFPDLVRQRQLPAGRLSGGQRQMLAVARALIVEPRLLLLDEPSAGLSPKIVDELFSKLRELCGTGVSIVMVEQNVRAALRVADRLYILVEGRNRLEGPTRDLLADPEVAGLFLGGAPPEARLPSPEASMPAPGAAS
jgi:branched-chain amino acid transport system ATP-binding protein